MDLALIVNRISEGIVSVDRTTKIVNQNKHGENYLPGIVTLYEPQFAKELMEWWKKSYSSDFQNIKNISTNYPYPNSTRTFCDIVFSSDNNFSDPEWAIEIKKIAFVGDNGKNNDYGPSKLLSPYLKDRSLSHDVAKLNAEKIARKKAVIGYGFNYSPASLMKNLSIHPSENVRINNAIKVCKSAGMPDSELHLEPLIEAADFLVQRMNITNPVIQKIFAGANRHPLGGDGLIFAWELKSY